MSGDLTPRTDLVVRIVPGGVTVERCDACGQDTAWSTVLHVLDPSPDGVGGSHAGTVRGCTTCDPMAGE